MPVVFASVGRADAVQRHHFGKYKGWSVESIWQCEEDQWMLDAADAIETLCGMVATAHQEISNIIASYEETLQRIKAIIEEREGGQGDA